MVVSVTACAGDGRLVPDASGERPKVAWPRLGGGRLEACQPLQRRDQPSVDVRNWTEQPTKAVEGAGNRQHALENNELKTCSST